MDKIFSILLILLATLGVCPALAQTMSPDEEGLARAIHRLKTGERGTLRWRECGSYLSADEALLRSQEYARFLTAEHASDPGFNPWIGASIAMQESSFNRCAISRGARNLFTEHFVQQYGHEPREADLVRLLRNRAWRSRMGVSTSFDAGLVQFRWPGVVAARVGLEDAGDLLDARTSIHMLAVSMRRYRTICDTVREFRGVHLVNRRDGTVRTVRYSIPCLEGYWVQHNSPQRFNYRYYRNVVRWRDRLRSLAVPSSPSSEEEPS